MEFMDLVLQHLFIKSACDRDCFTFGVEFSQFIDSIFNVGDSVLCAHNQSNTSVTVD